MGDKFSCEARRNARFAGPMPGSIHKPIGSIVISAFIPSTMRTSSSGRVIGGRNGRRDRGSAHHESRSELKYRKFRQRVREVLASGDHDRLIEYRKVHNDWKYDEDY